MVFRMLMLLCAGLLGPISIPGIPGTLEWRNQPVSWSAGENGLRIEAGAKTDWYISPLDGKKSANAPLLLFQPAPEFILTARVKVDFRNQWDAGFLMVWADDTTWAKFALEKSAYQEPTIVTVVTRGVSDDCNSVRVAGDSVYLRVARTGPAIIFYASEDGRTWRMVRAFTLGKAENLRVGFAAQSPLGERGTASFSEIVYAPRKVADVFAGQ